MITSLYLIAIVAPLVLLVGATLFSRSEQTRTGEPVARKGKTPRLADVARMEQITPVAGAPAPGTPALRAVTGMTRPTLPTPQVVPVAEALPASATERLAQVVSFGGPTVACLACAKPVPARATACPHCAAPTQQAQAG
ncbi:hypothetical protein [Conexibacter sp. SYSU D00693]|uniref:hypothetical protein n=1 Tax=Conexibacter sp. SYSU D00693 TaxID=2812560 RepID=UPI00196ACFF6|nr:hypothetical protein [Conexibacter sp. SYSU D00693]